MKKILVVGQTPPPYGGQALMIQRLLNGNYKHAKLYHVRMSFSKEMDDMGRLRFGKIFHMIALIFKIAGLRFRHNIKVLYYPPSGPAYIPMLRDMILLLSIRWMFKKTIFHFHAAGTSELYPQLSKCLQALFRMSYHNPDMAIQLSEYNPDDSGSFQAKTNYIVPNGIEDDFQILGHPQKPINRVCTILSVGLITESKGILVLIESARILKNIDVAIKVNVVGKFESEDFKQKVYAKIFEYGLEESFEFKGVLTGLDKHEQYINADIFCYPTFFEAESFGLVVVEAMQFGLPVIVSKWRGVQSLVRDGENGFLVPIMDSETIAEKIKILIDNPELRQKMGNSGRSLFLQEYTIDKFYNKMDMCFAGI